MVIEAAYVVARSFDVAELMNFRGAMQWTLLID